MPTPETDDLTNAVLDESFDSAFDEAIKPEGEKTEPVVPVEESTIKTELETPAAPEPVVPEPVVPAAPAAPVDIAAIVKAALEASKPEPVKVEDVVVAPTAEELAAEEQYRKDWPEHARREDQLKKEVEGLKTLLTEAVTSIRTQIAPVVESVNTSAATAHEQAILAVHKDAFDIAPAIVKWVEQQPTYLQPAYKNVLENGSAADVNAFLTAFKAATGVAEPAPLAQVIPDTRLQRMAVADTRRTSATAEPDPNDFDTAFEQGAKDLKAA